MSSSNTMAAAVTSISDDDIVSVALGGASSGASEVGHGQRFPVCNDLDTARWTAAFVWLGIAARLARYLARFPLWGDESFLAVNLVQRGYADLMRPLTLSQVAPLSYLWSERFLITTFGVSEFSLRAVAIVAGIGGLVLFRYVAGFVLNGWALVLSVGILAVSGYPIRHAAEVKPYASDLFAAMLILLPALAWRSAPDRKARLAWLIPAVIVAELLSYTAVFVAGGVSLALVSTVWRSRRSDVRRLFIAYNVAVVATFGLVLALAATGDNVGENMQVFWAEGFPPSWRMPGRWALWFASVHTGEALAYPFGGQDGASIVQLVLSVIGARSLWRAGARPTTASDAVGRTFVGITLGTLALAFIAALLHRYPYGIGARLQQYWAPFVCVLTARGVVDAIGMIKTSAKRSPTAKALALVLVIVGIGHSIHSLVRPYKFRQDYIHRSLAMWLWENSRVPSPLVSLEDFGTTVADDRWQFAYANLRAIYDVRFDYTSNDPQAPELRLNEVAVGAPLRVVTMKPDVEPFQPGRLERFQTAMSRHYRLIDEVRYPVTLGMEGSVPYTYHVWSYEPTSGDSHPRLVRAEFLNVAH